MKQNVLPSQGSTKYLDSIEIAIGREIKAKFMYQTMAKYAKQNHMKNKLNFLAQEEHSHRKNLEDLYKKIAGKTKKFDEIVEYPSEETAARMANVEMKDLLKVGIEKETEASQFYVEMAATTDEPSIREIFNYLSEEELTHRRMLELQLKLYSGERPMGNEASVEMIPSVYRDWW